MNSVQLKSCFCPYVGIDTHFWYRLVCIGYYQCTKMCEKLSIGTNTILDLYFSNYEKWRKCWFWSPLSMVCFLQLNIIRRYIQLLVYNFTRRKKLYEISTFSIWFNLNQKSKIKKERALPISWSDMSKV